MLITIIVIIGLSILILAHEAGHFFTAKRFGLRVDEFGFGFPPRLFAKKFGETEYSFNWIPFGGFVKIAGEHEAAPFTESESPSPYPSPPAVAKALVGRQEGGNLNDASSKRLFSFQPAYKRAAITVAGVTVNFILGWLLISLVFMIGTSPALVVADVQKDSPAAAAGIQSGDVLLNYTSAKDFISFTNAHRGETIQVELRRGGEHKIIQATPRITAAPHEGALGIAIAETGFAREGFFAALRDGFLEAVQVSVLTLVVLYQLIRELFMSHTLIPGVVGPIGIVSTAEQTASVGFIYLINLFAIISLNLAVMNLIPFPALDGGRLFMILIEKIKGSPISRTTERLVNTFGFAFLILLMVLISVRDVARVF